MESRLKFLGHPVHQMLIPLPAGLFISAAVLDIVDIWAEASWIPGVSFWNLALGCIAASVAALFGLLDWTRIPSGTRAKRVGALHGGSNAFALVLFGSAVWLRSRTQDYQVGTASLIFEVLALSLLAVAAWLGGELVDRLGVGVDDGAHVNAPSSLRAKRA